MHDDGKPSGERDSRAAHLGLAATANAQSFSFGGPL